jgi:hypothetical protein
MAEERAVPLPLSGEEVREAILFKISESLSRTCNLRNDDAYTSFEADITIHLRLDDYGREVKDNHIVTVKEGQSATLNYEPGPMHEVNVSLALAKQPPNRVRVETGQSVPVKTTQDGKQVIRKVKYAARKGAISGRP